MLLLLFQSPPNSPATKFPLQTLAAGLRSLGVVLLCLVVLLTGGWSLRPPSPSAAPAIHPSTPAGALQEVAPPLPVQQLLEQLDEHQPQLRILSPKDEAVLPAGPWELQLALDDWPLVEAGGLGIGPHLVVQVDDHVPLRIAAPATDGGATASLQVPMAGLSPGSHRLNVYAARPWGEAVKSAGGFRQIRLHRVAPNALQLPAPGSAQLISSIPADLLTAEPVPIDWLLVDAPLQQLRADDRNWLLRVTVNGDSFMVDRQTTLWLKGLRQGSNAVQLELLDGLGEPLNPPFNSLVQEVVLSTGGSSRWHQGRLTDGELDQLLGRAQSPAAGEPASQGSETETNPSTETAASGPPEQMDPDDPAARAPDPLPKPDQDDPKTNLEPPDASETP